MFITTIFINAVCICDIVQSFSCIRKGRACDSCRDAVGKFPDYPTEEEGGSLMIFKEKDPAEVEAALKALVSTEFL